MVLGLSLRDSSRESCGRVPGARGGCEYPDELVLGREYVALWCVCVLCCAVVVRPMYIQYTCMYKGVYSGFLAKLVCTLFFNLRLRLAL